MSDMGFLLKFLLLKLFYKKKVLLDGITKLSFSTAIKVSKGTIRFGKLVTTRKNVMITVSSGKIVIGKHTFFNVNCVVASRDAITIGDYCSFGPGVKIYDHDHMYDKDSFYHDAYKTAPIVIGDNCWIGAGSVILKGSEIGNGCVIAANSVVKGRIPAHSIYYANIEYTIKEIQ